MIAVTDTGIGMDKETLQKATSPFYSGFQPKGLGIGLGIARLVAVAHGGELEIESTEGNGTTARLRLQAGSTGEVATC